jgi:phage antirepressor YoqD-like protein
MSISNIPNIAGVEITTDEHGRFNLNSLHKASGLGDHKRPSKWIATNSAKNLVSELDTQSPNSGSALNLINGGSNPGTFAHELLAISYAGWISPSFQLKVNQVFLDYRAGKLQPVPVELSRLDLINMALIAEKERIYLANQNETLKLTIIENQPKIEFHDKITASGDSISVSEAAKMIGTGRARLFSFLRLKGWVTRKNEPYQSKINTGLMDVKLSYWEHDKRGLQQSVTALFTGKGLATIKALWDEQDQIAS